VWVLILVAEQNWRFRSSCCCLERTCWSSGYPAGTWCWCHANQLRRKNGYGHSQWSPGYRSYFKAPEHLHQQRWLRRLLWRRWWWARFRLKEKKQPPCQYRIINFMWLKFYKAFLILVQKKAKDQLLPFISSCSLWPNCWWLGKHDWFVDQPKHAVWAIFRWPPPCPLSQLKSFERDRRRLRA